MSDLKKFNTLENKLFFSSITRNRNTALGLVEGWLIKYISEFKIKIYFSYDNIYTKHEQETETLNKVHMKIQKSQPSLQTFAYNKDFRNFQ